MVLSRLILNPRNRRVQKEIADRYELHRSLMRAFADDLDDDEERVLFRVERSCSERDLTLLVQSWTLPDWTWLAEPGAHGYLLPVGEPNPAVKTFQLDLVPGQRLAFRLRANPTARRRCSDGVRRRVGLYDEEEQLDWLKRKAERGGFDLISVRTGGQKTVGGTVYRNGTRRELTLFSVQFDGLLAVRKPDRVRDAVREGIGSAKAFGFGLLSLAPPRFN
jgi:CRISPR system Cascade subunit CasE